MELVEYIKSYNDGNQKLGPRRFCFKSRVSSRKYLHKDGGNKKTMYGTILTNRNLMHRYGLGKEYWEQGITNETIKRF